MFRAHVLIIRRLKLQYIASGIIIPIGGRLVHLVHFMTYWQNAPNDNVNPVFYTVTNKYIIILQIITTQLLVLHILLNQIVALFFSNFSLVFL